MTEPVFFGEWIAQRRKALDLTQRDLAAQTNCALATIKKIETGDRRPSRDLAEGMAHPLRIAADKLAVFVEAARGVRPVESLRSIPLLTPDTEAVPTSAAQNLPAGPAPLIGRAIELTRIADALADPDCRLITLTGVGGVGKSRLALEAAREQKATFADGVLLIPLAAITDPALIPTAIAQSLRLSLSESQLFAYLRDKTMLLVLDNCEQLLDGIGWLSDLLAVAPGIKLLATSRERLQLAEEWLCPVSMLDEVAAGKLFIRTARRLNPNFQQTDHVEAIMRICALVEHLPLAVELAASWTSLLSCEEIATNIARDLDFLSANVRNTPDRHRSIRAVFDHSWRLLTPAEQDALMRLSVFRGGWTPPESDIVAGATLLILRSLVEKSLVRPPEQGRYDLHELIRQYAADQLASSGTEAETRLHHAEVYLVLAGWFDSQLHTAHGIEAHARLDHEQDNLRAALGWSLETGALDMARSFTDKLSLYWWRRGHWAEGLYWIQAVGALPGEADSTLLCWTLMDTAWFLSLHGRYADAVPYMERASAMAMRLEDPETTMRVLIVQMQTPVDIEMMTALFERLVATAELVETHSKGALDAMLAGGHDMYGDQLRGVGRIDEAEHHYRRSLDIWRRMGNVDGIAYPIGNLGRLALDAGHAQEAYDRISESVAISRAIGNRLGIADWLPQLGNALLSLGDVAQAEACYDEALALSEEIGNPVASAALLAYLGAVALLNGAVTSSRDYFRRSLTIYRDLSQQTVGDDASLPPECILCLKGLALLDVEVRHDVAVSDLGYRTDKALLDAQSRQDERALLLLSAASAMPPAQPLPPALSLHSRINAALHTLQSRLDRATFTRIWSSGQSTPPASLIPLALSAP